MPTTLTLKNIPDDVYIRLKTSAESNRRSLNSEVIVRLEEVLMPVKVSPRERLARIDKLRGSLGKIRINEKEINGFKQQGRA
jgi:antitoxin FitA